MMFSSGTFFHLRLFEFFGCCPVHQRETSSKIKIRLTLFFALHLAVCVCFLGDSLYFFHDIHRSEISIICGFVKICCALLANVVALVEAVTRWEKQKQFWKQYLQLRLLRTESSEVIAFNWKFLAETVALLVLIPATQFACVARLYHSEEVYGPYVICY